MDEQEEKYYNVCERYGEDHEVTIGDYKDLNPEGFFEIHTDGIREYFADESWEIVAVP